MKLFEILSLLSAFTLSIGGCAGGQSECQANAWSGTCRLLQVTKTRQVEFPLPNVTLEAVYRPLPTPAWPNFVAPDFRREFTSLERYEAALRAHIEARPELSCYVNPPAPGQCQPGQLVVDVPEFDAQRAAASQAPAGAKGCAQIEAASAQERLSRNESGTEVITEHFEFPEGSAELAPEASSPVEVLASRLKQNPNLECIGVVGTWVRGESIAVAFARARAVKDLLVQRGVEAERLLVLTVDPVAREASAGAEPPNPKDRRVTLSVLVNLPNRPKTGD